MKRKKKQESLKVQKIKHTLSAIPITERKNALCLRVHMATITVNDKDRWNISNSGGCIIFEKEGDSLRDYSLYLGDVLEKILEMRKKGAK